MFFLLKFNHSYREKKEKKREKTKNNYTRIGTTSTTEQGQSGILKPEKDNNEPDAKVQTGPNGRRF